VVCSLIPLDENIKDDSVSLNQTPKELLERVSGLFPPHGVDFFFCLFSPCNII
jgi:hypothetical protein